jgi:WD40 repeat protein
VHKAIAVLLTVLAGAVATAAVGQSSPECLFTLSGHTGEVLSVAFAPDGKTLASGSADNTVKVWDAATGTLLRTLSGHTDAVNSVAFSPDGSAIASGSADSTIKLWDAASGALLHTLTGHEKAVASVAFSPDGKVLASGSWDKTVKFWNTTTYAHRNTPAFHTSFVFCVAYSPDGDTLASGSQDRRILLWDAATRMVPSGGPLEHAGAVESVAFSADGRTLASGSMDNTIRLWDPASGMPLRTISGHTDWVRSVAFSADGHILASGSTDKTVRLWDASSGALLRILPAHTGAIESVAFCPDGKTLASGSDDKTVRLWDIQAVLAIPDLAIQSLTTSPTNPPLGQPTSFIVTVRNQGTAPAGAFRVGLSGTAASAYATVPSLAAGASTTLALSLTLSQNGETFTATADDLGQVAESDETNNSLSHAVEVATPPTALPCGLPLLAVSWQRLGGWVYSSGAIDITVWVTIENVEHSPSCDTRVRVYLLDESASWILDEMTFHAGDLGPGGSASFIGHLEAEGVSLDDLVVVAIRVWNSLGSERSPLFDDLYYLQ